MKKNIYLLLAIFLPLLTSCPMDWIFPIDIQNNSTQEIYSLCRWDDYYIKHSKINEDSTLYHITKIFPRHFGPIYEDSADPEDFLKSTDTLSIFILDKEEYEGKTWKQLVDSAKFKQIYHLSGDDIRRLGSKIPYPPTEIMRDMDIIPKYGEQKETD